MFMMANGPYSTKLPSKPQLGPPTAVAFSQRKRHKHQEVLDEELLWSGDAE